MLCKKIILIRRWNLFFVSQLFQALEIKKVGGRGGRGDAEISKYLQACNINSQKQGNSKWRLAFYSSFTLLAWWFIMGFGAVSSIRYRMYSIAQAPGGKLRTKRPADLWTAPLWGQSLKWLVCKLWEESSAHALSPSAEGMTTVRCGARWPADRRNP